jgi:hypothetical protein
MFSKNYYCLVSGLPDLIFNDFKKTTTGDELKALLSENLRSEDLLYANLLYLTYDNENILNLILKQGKAFKELGNYSLSDLEEHIKEQNFTIDYLNQFIRIYQSTEKDLSDLYWETKLMSLYYGYVLQAKNKFLRLWFKFSMDLSNILTWHNCNQFGYIIKDQLIDSKYNNQSFLYLSGDKPKTDWLLSDILLSKNILSITQSDNNLSEREMALDNLKWEFIDEYTYFNYFTIERILGYIIKTGIIERWKVHDPEKGKDLFEKLIHEMSTEHLPAD